MILSMEDRTNTFRLELHRGSSSPEYYFFLSLKIGKERVLKFRIEE